MTQEQFAEAVAERATQLGAEGWTVRARGTCVEVEAEGLRHLFHTDGSYRTCCAERVAAGAGDAVGRTAQRIVTIVAETPVVQRLLRDWEWARPRLQFGLVADVHTPSGALPNAGRPWLPGLSIGYVVADPLTLRISQVPEQLLGLWGVGEPCLWETALRGLRAAPASVRRVSRAAEIFGFCCAEGAGPGSAVQVLSADQMALAAQSCGTDDLAVGVPDSDTGVVCAAGGAAEDRMRRVVALMHAEAAQPLLGDPLRWRAGRWSRACPLFPD
jgi:hypothetical protein